MAAFTKTQGTSVLTHQKVTHPATVKGSAQDVSTKISATVILYHAIVENTANTNPGTFFVEISGSSSGDEDWAPYAQFTTKATTPATEALTATEPAAETVLAVASDAGFTVLDQVYIQDTTTETDSEWGRLQEKGGTTLTLLDGLTNGKDSADIIWNEAEIFICEIPLASVGRVRVTYMHEGTTGADTAVKALMVTGDSFV